MHIYPGLTLYNDRSWIAFIIDLISSITAILSVLKKKKKSSALKNRYQFWKSTAHTWIELRIPNWLHLNSNYSIKRLFRARYWVCSFFFFKQLQFFSERNIFLSKMVPYHSFGRLIKLMKTYLLLTVTSNADAFFNKIANKASRYT